MSTALHGLIYFYHGGRKGKPIEILCRDQAHRDDMLSKLCDDPEVEGFEVHWDPPIEKIAERMIRVAGEAVCDICGRPFLKHDWFLGHTIDDGTGRMRPWLREGCDGKLLKL